MYFHAPCGVVLCSVMCFYIVECNCNLYEHKKKAVHFSQDKHKRTFQFPRNVQQFFSDFKSTCLCR